MITVAVTGGIASGKTVILDEVADFEGVKTVQTDSLAKEIYHPDNPHFQQVVELFGTEIVNENCEIDIGRVSEMVFSDEELLRQLEELAHPYVEGRIEDIVERLESTGTKLAFVEIPLLFQSPDVELDMFDLIVLVEAGEETRIDRLVGRDGLSEEEARDRVKLQRLPDDAAEMSDYVIVTEGSVAETRIKARQLVKDLIE